MPKLRWRRLSVVRVTADPLNLAGEQFTRTPAREAQPHRRGSDHMFSRHVVTSRVPLCEAPVLAAVGNSAGNSSPDSPSFPSPVGSHS